MNELTRINETSLSPWETFANETLAVAIAGDLLRFVKGQWNRGEDKAQADLNAHFLCNMEEIWTGWVRWFDGKIVDRRLGRLIDFPPRILREELGDNDKSLWETDGKGDPRDPWAQNVTMVMREAGEPDSLLTFNSASWGARKAIGRLCANFAKHHKKENRKWPIVQLGRRIVTNKNYGDIWEPDFPIVGWDFWDDEHSDDVPVITPTPDDPRTLVQELDDEIPF